MNPADSPPSPSTTAKDPPVDPEIQALTAELEKEKLRAELAAAQSTRPRAVVGTSTSAGLEGKVDVGTGAGYAAELVGHHAVEENAGKIVADVISLLRQSGGPARVLVVTDRDLVRSDYPRALVAGEMTTLRSGLQRLGAALDDVVLASPHFIDEWLASLSADGQRAGPQLESLGSAAAETAAEPAPAAEAAADSATSAAPSIASALGVAADVASFLRTDYAMTARTVTMTSATLATIVAGRLGRGSDPSKVFLDAFDVVRQDSATYQGFLTLCSERDQVERRKTEIESAISPLKAHRDALAADLEKGRAALTTAIGEKKGAGVLDLLRREIATTSRELVRTRTLVDPATVVLGSVDRYLEAIDLFRTEVTAVPASGYPLLVSAAIRDLLHDGAQQLTHVLFVSSDSVGGEVVTRRTLFGESGVISFIGGSSTSWALMRVDDGAVVEGRQERSMNRLAYNLGSGKAAWVPLSIDPEATFKGESNAPVVLSGLVAVLVVVLLIAIVVLGTVNIVT
jgi:hypothetical protein